MLTAQTANRKDLRTTTCRMEHRHFATIAAILRELPTESFGLTVPQCEGIAKFFADELRSTNPNFNRTRFLAACDVREA